MSTASLSPAACSRPFRPLPALARSRQNTFSKGSDDLSQQLSQVYARVSHMATLLQDKPVPASQRASSASEDASSESLLAVITLPRPTTSSPTSTALEPCACQGVCAVATPGRCGLCGEAIGPVATLRERVAQLEGELTTSQEAVADLQRQVALQKRDEATLASRVVTLENDLDQSRQEAASLHHDVRVLNDKYVDQINRVGEILHAKQLVEDELEDLSQKLFEQANGMVASEARQRHEKEQRLAETEAKLVEAHQTLAEQKQAMQALRDANRQLQTQLAAHTPQSLSPSDRDGPRPELLSAASMATQGTMATVVDPIDDGLDSPMLDQVTDEQLFLEFQDFVFHCPTTKHIKLHTLAFLRNCWAEDVEPCLRFGPNPRISTKNLQDALFFGTLVLQATNCDERPQAPPVAEPAPSSKWFLASKQALLWERLSGTVQANPHGCQACGRTGECTHRFQMGYYEENEEWCYIDQFCRDRLVAVSDFYQFIRHIHLGYYSSRSMQNLYLESQRLRLRMLYARMGSLGLFRTNPDYYVRKLNAPSMVPRRSASKASSTRSTADPEACTSESTPIPSLGIGNAPRAESGPLEPTKFAPVQQWLSRTPPNRGTLLQEAERLRARSLSLPKLGNLLAAATSTTNGTDAMASRPPGTRHSSPPQPTPPTVAPTDPE
ncbi:hypothetical protein H4R34_002489 [Dimargaris verticillata]|uniref:GDP/GTP exchange factor Sec2 N-terminal domain-containing protein n=1 Tax=Dimargaris verticillata TaxID=2761393 RepID=A0A9W8B420_9FUNG|nr:hypothetical protein H4R34_002489 [Dimargaris verticillata]